MFWLLFFYILIYGAIHAALWWRLRPLLPWRAWRWPLLALTVVMIALPLCARVLERSGHSGLAEVLAWAGFMWMALVLVGFIVAELTWLAQVLGAAVGKGWWGRDRLFAGICLLLTPLVFAYGLWEARDIRVERLTVPVAGLPPGVDRVRMVLISDVHIGLLVGAGRLKSIARIIEKQKPDLILSAGDLVDGSLEHRGGDAKVLALLKPPLGKYGVMGNHEFYAGEKNSLEFHKRAGFKVLRGQVVQPGGVLNLAGVDYPGHMSAATGEGAMLGRIKPGLPVVLLKHQPKVAPDARGRFDLMLSGHTHQGQIFPFSLVVKVAYPNLSGSYPQDGGGLLYVSRGAATWGPPIRLLAPPEITVIDLVRKK